MAKEPARIACGDIVRLRKTHPCGSDEWEITRVGADVGLVCKGCGHKVMMSRADFERHLKGFVSHA